MEAKGKSSVKVQGNSEGFIVIITSAFCEWFLIFLLFVDALLSYLLIKFADYCHLQKPCILCSRFERVVGNESPQLYEELLCSNHVSKLASWIAASKIYGKHDGNGMSEDSFCPYSNLEMHLSSVANSGSDVESYVVQRPLLKGKFVRTPVGVEPCSYCSSPWGPKENIRGRKPKSSGTRSPKPNIPLPRLPNRNRLHRNRDSSKKIRDKSPASVTSRHSEKVGHDPVSYVGYTELKFSSDTDADFMFSGDEYGHGLTMEGFRVQYDSENSVKAPPNGLKSAKRRNRSARHKRAVSEQWPVISKASDVKSLGSDIGSENGLGELNWQHSSQKSNPSALPELISLDDFLPSPNFEKRDITGAAGFGDAPFNKNIELLTPIRATDGASIRERDLSGINIEKPTLKKPDRIQEDFKLLASQYSSTQKINLPPKDTSSKVGDWDDEKQSTDASSSNAKPILNTSASVESGLESLDGGYVSEIEGESIVDRLKRQIDYDRKCMMELYKELEAERNASAIAANQAMAMITKLQEEKAAFHMDALHYLRMMEEQAEFDVEALEKANDLLAEKEKEIQDLEAELEFCKFDFPEESMIVNTHDQICDLKGGTGTMESTVVPNVKDDVNATCNSMATEEVRDSNGPLFSETTLLEFEDEKLYITNCLKTLERKLSELSCKGDSSKLLNGGHSQKNMDDVRNAETPRKLNNLSNGQLEQNVLHGQTNLHMSNGSSAAEEETVDCDGGDDDGLVCDENNDSISGGENDSMDPREKELLVMENEISDLNDRLEALETDHDFLEHMIYSLQNGAEGLHFVREIAQQLQELRKIGTVFRSQSIS